MNSNVPMKKSKGSNALSNLLFLIVTGIIISFCILAYLKRGDYENSVTREAAGQPEPADYSIAEELREHDIPFLYQTDERWKDVPYGNGNIELKGCGPTCLSMVAAGLLKDSGLSPVRVAEYSEEWNFVEDNAGTSWKLMTEGAQKLGLISEELPLSEDRMKQSLLEGKPVICAMGPGDFTDEGHFIVLTDYKDGGFAVHDPNSEENSKKIWCYEDIEHQIRNIWSFTKAG